MFQIKKKNNNKKTVPSLCGMSSTVTLPKNIRDWLWKEGLEPFNPFLKMLCVGMNAILDFLGGKPRLPQTQGSQGEMCDAMTSDLCVTRSENTINQECPVLSEWSISTVYLSLFYRDHLYGL